MNEASHDHAKVGGTDRPNHDRLVLLGTKGGPAIHPGSPMPTSTLVEMAGRRVVVDCGLGVTRGLCGAGVRLPAIDAIVVTHLHSDHVLEFGPLVLTAWMAGLDRPIRVAGPPGLAALWDAFLASMRVDVAIRVEDEGRPHPRDLVEIEECEGGTLLDLPGLGIEAMPVPHPPVEPTLALRFLGENGRTRLALSADTAYHPPLAGFARDADVLVHEAMLPAGVDALVARIGNGARLREHLVASHTSAPDAGRIASLAGVGHLVLHHLVPSDDPDFSEADWIAAVRGTWDGELTIGRDGLAIPLGG